MRKTTWIFGIYAFVQSAVFTQLTHRSWSRWVLSPLTGRTG
jgi:hypothetical protein